MSAPCLSPLSCLVARKGFIGPKASCGLLNLHGGKPSAQPLVKYSGPLLAFPAQHIGCTGGVLFSGYGGNMVAPSFRAPRVQGVEH